MGRKQKGLPRTKMFRGKKYQYYDSVPYYKGIERETQWRCHSLSTKHGIKCKPIRIGKRYAIYVKGTKRQLVEL